MDFKNLPLKPVILVLSLGFLLFISLLWGFSSKADLPIWGNSTAQDALPDPAPPVLQPAVMAGNEDDFAIQEQLDRDRLEQNQTKDLKIKLEQTNLELEQEKAYAQLNKLKMENVGVLNETAVEGNNKIPEIKIEYIGGNSVNKEAILSIGGTSYQVKERSFPVGDIQVVSITDSSVTLHFSAPQDMTKIIDYKPE